MNKYKLRVEIESEAIFTSGEAESNTVSSKLLSDEYGFAYYHAKTLKGQLKKQGFWLLDQYKQMENERDREKAFGKSLVKLFGMNKEEKEKYWSKDAKICGSAGTLKLTNLELDPKIREFFIEMQEQDKKKGYFRLNPNDLIEAQTNIRTKIRIEDGVAKKNRLGSYHTVKKGLVFYSELYFEDEEKIYLDDFYRIAKSLKYLGAGVHRGRGRVEVNFLENDNEYCLGGRE
ncbi:MAG: hypothetical protein COA82_03320 [Alkaliphilus sp.]|nr:hypothetical protein [bacterium AH-315-E09]PHS35836.1 MAG: hypothetical protein COA82_03320 [Alkaliphilus sp.]